MRKSRLIIGLLAVVLAAGCGDQAKPEGKAAVELKGVEFRLSIAKGSPLVDAIRYRVADWEARTQATVRIEETDPVDPKADLCIVPGTALNRTLPARPIPKEMLGEGRPAGTGSRTGEETENPSRRVQFTQLPAVYRLRFVKRDGDTIAFPLSTDRVLLWYRSDLFASEPLVKAYREETNRELKPPETWSDYLELAKFFQDQKAAEFGCAEAMDESPAAVRELFRPGRGLFEEPQLAIVLALDAETGDPLISSPGFVRALAEWAEARKYSPAAMGKPIDGPAARHVFREGKAAMLLSDLPPTIAAEAKADERLAEKMSVAPLPGSKTVIDPRSGQSTQSEKTNRCEHFATTGWYMTLGEAVNTAAAERLLLFLADAEESVFLVQGARRGVLPIRPMLLNEPSRFRGYGLPTSTISTLFVLISEGFQNENWVTDLRTSFAGELHLRLVPHLQRALAAKIPPAKALHEASHAWKEFIESRKKEVVEEYRESLGLPKLQTAAAGDDPK